MDVVVEVLQNLGISKEHYPLFALPVIGALIGWMTNYVAVKMLFHPKRPIPLVLFTLHGVFPKRQKALAQKLGSLVSSELFSVEEVSAHLREKAQSEEILGVVSDHIEHIIRHKLPEVVPMVAMVLTDDLVRTVKSAFVVELKDFVSRMTDTLSESLQEELDIHKIVEEKVMNFSSDKLEEILNAIMRREFRFIELVGAVLGFLIGVGQMWYLLVL
ncbi:MAG: DUF445 family protein [Bdellovibrionales bacterium]|nr:DUF445 family protein [Bdellovibrionales bacterium]